VNQGREPGEKEESQRTQRDKPRPENSSKRTRTLLPTKNADQTTTQNNDVPHHMFPRNIMPRVLIVSIRAPIYMGAPGISPN
jgi:hypothetical protein